MIIKQIWTGNSYRNFNYIIACRETGEALAIDPLDHQKCLHISKTEGFEIKQVLNTHEHGDHTGGNTQVIAATGAKLLAHANAIGVIDGISQGLKARDVIKVGKSVELECLDTPGHTMSHICLLSHGDIPALFCGDTLFNAGAGNCHSGGHPEELYHTFSRQLATLPDNTLVYPGHDYISNNLEFTLDREPNNSAAENLLQQVKGQNPEEPLVSTLSLEKEINTFLRLHNPIIREKLRATFPNLPKELDDKTVFLKLRELRNNW